MMPADELLVDRSDIFIDQTIMPGMWSQAQKDAWTAWATQALEQGEWTPEVGSVRGRRGPNGERYALLGFSENGQLRGYEPPRI